MTNLKRLDAMAHSDFVQTVFREAIAAGERLYSLEQLIELDPEPTRPLTEHEFYLERCGVALSHLLLKLEQLARIPGYIHEYYRTAAMARHGVTRFHDVSYHYENFIIRAKSID